MELNRKRLVKDLSFFSESLGQNALFPIFQCFHISGSGILVTDGSCMITGELEGDTGLQCALPGSKFLDLLESLKDEKVELLQRRDKVYIETIPERTTAKFLTVGEGNVIHAPTYDDIKWFDVPIGLLSGLHSCSFAVSSDETSGIITGVCVVNDEVYGTDKSRAARYFLKDPVDFDAVVPVKFIDIIMSCPDDVEQLAVQDKKIYIKLVNGSIVSSCLLEGDYPDLDKYFPDTDRMKVIEFLDDTSGVLDRHLSFLSGKRKIDKHTDLWIHEKLCEFSSEDIALGKIVDVVSMKESISKEIMIALNPEFLKEVNFSKFYYDEEKGMVIVKQGGLEYLVLDRR